MADCDKTGVYQWCCNTDVKLVQLRSQTTSGTVQNEYKGPIVHMCRECRKSNCGGFKIVQSEQTIEDRILKAISDYGGRAATWNVANRIGMRGKTSAVLKTMKKLEADGKVQRHPHTERNNIVWMKAKEAERRG